MLHNSYIVEYKIITLFTQLLRNFNASAFYCDNLKIKMYDLECY